MQQFIVSGEIMWANIYPRNMKTTYKPEGEYVLTLYPDEESIKTLEEIGLGHRINAANDKHEKAYMHFRRPSLKPIWGADRKPTGDYEPNTPPVVVDKDLNTFDENIGNGTVGEVQFRTYDSRGGKCAELIGVQVLEHVPYEGGEGGDKIAFTKKSTD